MAHQVTLIPGDGIGPEVCEATVAILNATGVQIDWEHAEAGEHCLRMGLPVLPEETFASIARTKVALKGPTTTPLSGGHASVNVQLRKRLDTYANVRPAKSLPGVHCIHPNVDIITVRENTEGSYVGIEHRPSPDVATMLKITSHSGSTRIARHAFELATRLGRHTVTAIHKSNIMKLTDGLFLHCCREVAAEYPEIQFGDMIIDNACMQLVTKPHQFDVMLLPNLFGDIVSDLCAGLVGGLGVAPSANIGDHCAVFEAVHGSAPDIAGRGIANPTAVVLSGAMMLHHLGERTAAHLVEDAVFTVLHNGKVRTGDLGGRATTIEYTRAVIDAMYMCEWPRDESAHRPGGAR